MTNITQKPQPRVTLAGTRAARQDTQDGRDEIKRWAQKSASHQNKILKE